MVDALGEPTVSSCPGAVRFRQGPDKNQGVLSAIDFPPKSWRVSPLWDLLAMLSGLSFGFDPERIRFPVSPTQAGYIDAESRKLIQRVDRRHRIRSPGRPDSVLDHIGGDKLMLPKKGRVPGQGRGGGWAAHFRYSLPPRAILQFRGCRQ